MTRLIKGALNVDICPYSALSLTAYLLAASSLWAWPQPALGHQIAFALSPSILVILSYKLFPRVIVQAPNRCYLQSTKETIQVILCSAALGLALNFGLSLAITGGHYHYNQQHQQIDSSSYCLPLGLYICLLSIFHFSEYFVTSLTNPATLNTSSFLLENSLAYTLAISFSLLEFGFEQYIRPEVKSFNLISKFGLFLAISGELIRKSAMFTAGRSFSHTIVSRREPDHKLVTHGIYSVFRHPAYAGWFYWVIGTQILLRNALSMVVFIVLTYRFFQRRIIYEEGLLIKFFGHQYLAYKKRVGLWMPVKVL